MILANRLAIALVVVSLCFAVVPGLVFGAAPSVEQALKLAPVQSGVDYTRPTPEEAAKCTITAQKIDGKSGWIVEDSNGMILRKFVDTNGDNIVDQWSYYKDGIEVYRDIDTDFNGKVNQYRWFNTGGTRWGVSKKEDGKIDFWKQISPEEVTAEVVAALAERNAERFARVALSNEELTALGLGKEKAERLQEKVTSLLGEFRKSAGQDKNTSPQTQWVQFSASRPGVVPSGTDGSTQDLRVYENAVAIVEAAGKHGQVHIGTLIQIGDGWRVIEVPQYINDGQTEAGSPGLFFQASLVARNDSGSAGTNEGNQKLLGDLEALDKAAGAITTADQRAQYTNRRADLLEKIAQQTRNPQDRAMWLRQLAEMIAAAVQSGGYAEGPKRLEALFEKLQKEEADKDLAAHVQYLKLTAEYTIAIQTSKDFAKIQTEWLKNLEQFVTSYPKSSDASEAMLQLAIAQEFAGEEDAAKKWYGRIVKDFANTPAAQKANGAQIRLDSEGKVINITGKAVGGGTIDLSKYRGKVVLLQYWATWCEPARNDMAALKDLSKKYGNSFAVVGVSLDNEAKELNAYLSEAKLPWPQIFEEGGLDSRPANQLGILTLPTMILVDQQGKVVDRNIQTAELAGALKKLIK
jgi:thiol-disulfide isomerase/thioredoxin